MEIDFSEQAIAAALAGFQQLERAIIDASSMIYLTKAGYFLLVSRALKLFTLPEILSEVGFSVENISLLEPLPAVSNDKKLLVTAVAGSLPVISEDKRVLLGAQRAGLLFYNALMLLNLLLFRRVIDRFEYLNYLNQLKQCARYHPQVWRFGEKVFESVWDGQRTRPF
jgi:hypothetical protein